MSDGAQLRTWNRYVAIGDSFTEGMCDEDPSAPGAFRGWADLLAGELSAARIAAGLPPIEYANLAVRGRLLRPILAEQLPQALSYQPDLISIVGGGNDILRPSVNLTAMLGALERAVAKARSSGADVLLATSADPIASPLIKLTRGRAAIYYTSIWSIAQRYGAHVIDLWGMRSLRDWREWAPDRIHLTSTGHRRVAQAALAALDLPVTWPQWDDPLPPDAAKGPVQELSWNLTWLHDHVYPWATRRLHHRSSGDERVAKRPEPAPWPE